MELVNQTYKSKYKSVPSWRIAQKQCHVEQSFGYDEKRQRLKSNETILGVGNIVVEKHGISKAQDTTQTMRELSRLLIQLGKMEKSQHAQLAQFIVPAKFDVVDVVKALCTFKLKDRKRDIGTPSLALKIGYGLKRCVNVLV